MTEKLISVLIPCRNQGLFLSDCLDSIREQKIESSLEIIVVDDGSEDDTEKICRRYPEVKYIRQEQRGVSAARNRLLKESSGEFIAFVDADDIFVPEKLRLQLRYLQEHPKCPFVGCNVMSFYGSVPSPPYCKNEVSEKFLIPCMIRKSVFDQVGPFDESISVGEDTEYLIRISEKGITGGYTLDKTLYLRRLRDEGASHRSPEKELSEMAFSIIRARQNARRGTVFSKQ